MPMAWLQVYIAMLAAMKAGAAYVAIDPGYPTDRIAYTLADSGAAVVITDTRNGARLRREVCGSLC